jgi:prepilin-type N-terminal cleavage/methylation domain-containing protein
MEIPSPKGLSLLEMVLALAIMAIMTSVLYPDYRDFMLQRRLHGAALAVKLDFMLARAQAISMNRDIVVLFSPSPSRQYTYDAAGNRVTKNIQKDMGYYDVTVSADNNPIFTSRGIAKNTAGSNPVATVTLSNPAGSKTVTVNIAGYAAIN